MYRERVYDGGGNGTDDESSVSGNTTENRVYSPSSGIRRLSDSERNLTVEQRRELAEARARLEAFQREHPSNSASDLIEWRENTTHIDITDYWDDYIPTGRITIIDGAFPVDRAGNIIDVEGMITAIDHNSSERGVASALSRQVHSEIELIPRINVPKGIRTPDFMIPSTGETWELKTLERYNDEGQLVSPNSFFRAVRGANGQSDSVIVDISSYPYGAETVTEQINTVFRHSNTTFVQRVMIIKDGEIQSVFMRN